MPMFSSQAAGSPLPLGLGLFMNPNDPRTPLMRLGMAGAGGQAAQGGGLMGALAGIFGGNRQTGSGSGSGGSGSSSGSRSESGYTPEQVIRSQEQMADWFRQRPIAPMWHGNGAWGTVLPMATNIGTGFASTFIPTRSEQRIRDNQRLRQEALTGLVDVPAGDLNRRLTASGIPELETLGVQGLQASAAREEALAIEQRRRDIMLRQLEALFGSAGGAGGGGAGGSGQATGVGAMGSPLLDQAFQQSILEAQQGFAGGAGAGTAGGATGPTDVPILPGLSGPEVIPTPSTAITNPQGRTGNANVSFAHADAERRPPPTPPPLPGRMNLGLPPPPESDGGGLVSLAQASGGTGIGGPSVSSGATAVPPPAPGTGRSLSDIINNATGSAGNVTAQGFSVAPPSARPPPSGVAPPPGGASGGLGVSIDPMSIPAVRRAVIGNLLLGDARGAFNAYEAEIGRQREGQVAEERAFGTKTGEGRVSDARGSQAAATMWGFTDQLERVANALGNARLALALSPWGPGSTVGGAVSRYASPQSFNDRNVLMAYIDNIVVQARESQRGLGTLTEGEQATLERAYAGMRNSTDPASFFNQLDTIRHVLSRRIPGRENFVPRWITAAEAEQANRGTGQGAGQGTGQAGAAPPPSGTTGAAPPPGGATTGVQFDASNMPPETEGQVFLNPETGVYGQVRGRVWRPAPWLFPRGQPWIGMQMNR